jgi:hypothetical protein
MKKMIASLLVLVLILSMVACGSDDNTENRENAPELSKEMEQVIETAETPKAIKVSGTDGDRDVSGFDIKTNQKITWCGIDFSFPSYFNVLHEDSSETWITYYPEEENYFASIMFQSYEFSGTQEYFNSRIPYIVESTLDSSGPFVNTEIQKSEEILIAGLPGWTIELSIVDTDGDGINSNVSYSFVYNINAEKIAMITCIYDSNDQSQYDYLGDFNKVLETAKLSEESLKTEETLEKAEVFEGYQIIEVGGGDLSGYREPNVAVDIGFGDREYWAFTNEYGQLVRVIAKKIILQDDKNEPVTSDGRYYKDGAKVPGTESETLDEGHVIADSLGGVSNAYNITPQDSTLNKHGDQAYMEKVIRDAGGCTDFEAIITYPNTKTQIPSKYKYTYTLKGNVIVDEFDNINPDEYNESIGLTKKTTDNSNTEEHDISSIDTNGNGIVTIKEAKAAGFKMPITKDHWLYKYMKDADGDGMVGE